MSSVPERADVDAEYRWDLTGMFPDDDAWRRAADAVEERLDELRAHDGDDVTDGESLLAVLELRDEIEREVERVVKYARLRRDEDTRDADAQAMYNRAQSIGASFEGAASFVEPAIQSFSAPELSAMVEETPGLGTYDHYLEDVHRLSEHIRSPEVENLLAELSDVTPATGDVYTMLLNADLAFPTVERPGGEPVEVTLGNFTKLQQDPDRDFRRRVYEAFYDEFADVRNAIATAYERSIAANVKVARARRYETAREHALDGPNVPVSVYDSLLSAIRDGLDTLHRHAELKRRHLGVDDLRMWDLYTPLVDEEQPEIPFEDACDHVVEAVAPLGEEYQDRVRRGLDSRWVDVYENRGKRSGAYSASIYDAQPYILMNYTDDVDSMFTLAHELGHSLHSQLSSERQPFVYASYTTFVAEVASTVNETLLTSHLLDTVEDDVLRKYVLNQYLERFRSTMYRQTMFADFEHRTHRRYEQGESLTPDDFDDVYGDLKSEFYADAVVDDRIAMEWMRIPHFYAQFYVFQYSTGIAAAVALAADIVEEGEPAAERYLSFLRSGSRGYPIDLLAEAGVDMTTVDPIERAIRVYDDHLDEMAELV